uniref:Uncharacterized protein n=1 Tax=Oryza brachyantha TaxID=4533 RepID=J3LJ17_ORYBR
MEARGRARAFASSFLEASRTVSRFPSLSISIDCGFRFRFHASLCVCINNNNRPPECPALGVGGTTILARFQTKVYISIFCSADLFVLSFFKPMSTDYHSVC